MDIVGSIKSLSELGNVSAPILMLIIIVMLVRGDLVSAKVMKRIVSSIIADLNVGSMQGDIKDIKKDVADIKASASNTRPRGF